jgi:hypothetical protein
MNTDRQDIRSQIRRQRDRLVADGLHPEHWCLAMVGSPLPPGMNMEFYYGCIVRESRHLEPGAVEVTADIDQKLANLWMKAKRPPDR